MGNKISIDKLIKIKNRSMSDFLSLVNDYSNSKQISGICKMTSVKGITALMLVSKYSDLNIVKKYVKYSDINKKNVYGYTALGYCLLQRNKNEEIIKYLLRKGADPNLKTADGANALMLALYSKTSYDIIKLLINKCNINDLDNGKHNALMYLFKNNSRSHKIVFNLMKKMIDKGIDIDHVSINNETALTILCKTGSFKNIEYLARRSDIHHLDVYGDSILKKCVHNHELLELFLRLGLNPNIYNKKEELVIYYACLNNHYNSVDILLDYTPYDYLVRLLKVSRTDDILNMILSKINDIHYKKIIKKNNYHHVLSCIPEGQRQMRWGKSMSEKIAKCHFEYLNDNLNIPADVSNFLSIQSEDDYYKFQDYFESKYCGN